MTESVFESTPPASIGDYTVLRELGRGGMGVVYEAEQAGTGRRVALKVVRGGQFVDESVLRLFRREIQALARLEHPGVASLYASGRTGDGLHYFAMELVRGRPLDVWIRERGRGPFDGAELQARLERFLEIADAVAYAHQRGVLHRDIKPSNLVVSDDGRVKVLDFGLARITDVDVARATQATEAGTVRGTLAYMSPEQLSKDPEAVDVRADVYALGVVLYETLAGEHPFDLDRVPAFEIPRVILHEPPKSLARVWKGARRLDPDLATIVGKALEKDPARRYATVPALADDLRRYLAGLPILARAPSAAYQLRKLIGRHKGPAIAIAACAILVVAFAISMALLARTLAVERNRANREALAAEQATKVLSGLVRTDLMVRGYATRTLDPKEIERAVSDLEKRWPDKPEAAAQLMEDVGAALGAAGFYDPATRFLERSVAIRRDVLHDPHWETTSHWITLAEFEVQAGRLREADAIFGRIVASLRAQPDVTPNNLGYALEDYGCTRRDLGDWDTADRLLHEALEKYSYQQPVWVPYVASAHDSLGTLALARGDLEGAEREHREALRLRVGYSPGDGSVARSRAMLGRVLVRRGRLAEAEPLLDGALARREELNGPDAPEIAEILDALAELHVARGQPDLADADLARAIAIFDAKLPGLHPARATALTHLAELRTRQGRAREAGEALRGALAIREKVLGPEHPDTKAVAQAVAALPL